MTLLILLDISPMVYQRIYGNGGTFVKYYNFKISGDSLLSVLTTEFKPNQLGADKPYIQSILPDKNKSGFTYIQFYNSKTSEYIHIWIRTNQKFSSGSNIVFYGISTASNFHYCNIINRDYDYIFRKVTTDKFERLIIDRLIEMGIT